MEVRQYRKMCIRDRHGGKLYKRKHALGKKREIYNHDNTEYNPVYTEHLEIMVSDVAQKQPDRKDGHDDGYQGSDYQQKPFRA